MLFYEVQELIPSAGDFSIANDVNSFGDVVGYSSDTNLGTVVATFWPRGSTTGIALNTTLPISYAYGINDYGLMVGTQMSQSEDIGVGGDAGSGQGIIWLSNELVVVKPESEARACNSSAMIVGSSSPEPLPGKTQFAVNIAINGVPIQLAEPTSAAMSISNIAPWSIVGWKGSEGTRTAARWSWSINHWMEVPLEQPEGSNFALGINDFNNSVGTVIPNDKPPSMAVRWAPDGTMKNLGVVSGFASSTASGINNKSQIVGSCQKSDASSIAFIYRALPFPGSKYALEQMYDLNAFLLPGSGWKLNQANAVNDKGQIVGLGTINNQQRAFRATPLENVSFQLPPDWLQRTRNWPNPPPPPSPMGGGEGQHRSRTNKESLYEAGLSVQALLLESIRSSAIDPEGCRELLQRIQYEAAHFLATRSRG